MGAVKMGEERMVEEEMGGVKVIIKTIIYIIII